MLSHLDFTPIGRAVYVAILRIDNVDRQALAHIIFRVTHRPAGIAGLKILEYRRTMCREPPIQSKYRDRLPSFNLPWQMVLPALVAVALLWTSFYTVHRD